jgi:hypothetical protein
MAWNWLDNIVMMDVPPAEDGTRRQYRTWPACLSGAKTRRCDKIEGFEASGKLALDILRFLCSAQCCPGWL